jgi:hypothetical protein
MWLITTTGFYSVVEKPWDRPTGTLTVRARVHADLESLKATSLPELGEIKEDSDADYRYRAQAPREAVARAVQAQVAGINYDNFKNAVGRRQGRERAAVYHDVWGVLYELQSGQDNLSVSP